MTNIVFLALVGVAVAIGAAWAMMRRLRYEIDSLRDSEASPGRLVPGQDSLTGLTNRDGLIVSLRGPRAREADHDGEIGIVVLDLAGFGQLNETMGRDAGDRVLVETAARLTSTVRAGENLARSGGDRFIVVLEPPLSKFGAIRAASRMAACIAEPLTIDGVRIQLSAHTGVAIGPRDDFTQVIDNAEFAVNRARRASSNSVVLYEESLRRAADRSFHKAQQLKSAVAHGELYVAYQPIHRLDNGSLASFEALLRWQSPNLGPVSPTDFIPIAEDTGAIIEIGAWVLEQACCDLTAIAGDDDNMKVSVNVSVHQLRRAGFVDMVRTVLIGSGLAPHRLQLEVTESVIASPDEVGVHLDELRELGVWLALDDVGTGYSSLGQLAKLPINTMKLDRSLLQGAHDPGQTASRVFTSLAALGRSLSLDVIAEGIETEAQSSLAREAGCSHEQGFLRSRPVPVEEAAAYAASISAHRPAV